MTAKNPIVNLIIQGARRRGLDPNAVLAVARVEGLSGRIGDGGHAYGPFQLNNAGGVITNMYPGSYRQDVQRWANSPAGINFALDRIARVARGKTGKAAVAAIVSGFERPADIPGEIGRASALYGGGGGMGPVGVRPPRQAPAPQQPGLMAALEYGNALFGLPPVLPNLPAVKPARLGKPVNVPVGGVKPPRRGGRTLNWLEHFAAPFGLQVTSTTSGGHVKGSYHYRGRAVDFGGDPARMAALAREALKHPEQITEMFYTGPGNPGYFIKNGKVYPLSQLNPRDYANHKNHVHLAR